MSQNCGHHLCLHTQIHGFPKTRIVAVQKELGMPIETTRKILAWMGTLDQNGWQGNWLGMAVECSQ
jgi:hypothetical protein